MRVNAHRTASELIPPWPCPLRNNALCAMDNTVFSIAMESANGLDKLSAASTEIERKFMEDNAAAAMKVCLQGFRLGARIAGQCGLELAREAFIPELPALYL